MAKITNASIKYLIEVQENDSREWYTTHKEDYKKLIYTPMCELAAKIGETLYNIDNELYSDARPAKHLSRIYRDTRFSKDKRLYRDTAWLTFEADKKAYYMSPSFYFEFSPRLIRWGVGSYSVDTATMREIRAAILDDDKMWHEADKAIRDNGFLIEGEEYKKDNYPDQPENKKEWLNKKSFYIVKNCYDPEVLFSDNLANMLISEFKTLEPAYRFLVKFRKRIDE